MVLPVPAILTAPVGEYPSQRKPMGIKKQNDHVVEHIRRGQVVSEPNVNFTPSGGQKNKQKIQEKRRKR
jgi:hypothetical protein